MTRPANLHAVHACLADTISALQAQGLPVPTALHHAIVVLGRHNLSVERAHKSLQPHCPGLRRSFPERKGPWSQS